MMHIEELSKLLESSLKTEIDAQDYINGINQVFEGSSISASKQGQIIIRAYQDHASSRDYLIDKMRKETARSLEILEKCGREVIPTLVNCYAGEQASLSLMLAIKRRLKTKNADSIFLLSVVLQLLKESRYDFIDIRFLVKELLMRCNDDQLKPLVLILFSLLDKTYSSTFKTCLAETLTSFLIEAEVDATDGSLLLVIEALIELYPAFTTLCTNVFLSEEFQTLTRKKISASDELVYRLLSLLSVACVDETVRAYIADNYADALNDSIKIEKFKVHSSLVLVKTWNFTKLKTVTVEELGSNFTKALGGFQLHEELAVEGLAYLTLQSSVKAALLKKDDTLLYLVKRLNSKEIPPTEHYGIMVVLANLSSPLDESSSRQRALQGLQAYADLKRPDNSKDVASPTNEEVIAFNKEYILDLNTLGLLKSGFRDQSSGSNLQLVRIIHNLSRNKEFINESVQQGSVAVLLETLASIKMPADFKLLALRSLARILAMVNPELVFRRFSALTAVPYLFELIPVPTQPASNDQIDPKDTYEALLALTNLVTIQESDSICQKIVTSPVYWEQLEGLILDTTVEIQRSVLELLCNLMAGSLHLAVKFFNFDNPQSLRNFNILVKLLNLKDIRSQMAVTGIFANISSSVPFLAKELASKQDLIRATIDLLQNQGQDAELRHRLIIFFDAIVSASPETFRNNSQKDSLKKALLEARKYEASNSSDYLSAIDVMLKAF